MNKITLDAIRLGLKNWWKVALILLIVGLFVSGWAFKIGPLACDKKPVKFSEVTPEIVTPAAKN
jgi:hypothetical protein